MKVAVTHVNDQFFYVLVGKTEMIVPQDTLSRLSAYIEVAIREHHMTTRRMQHEEDTQRFHDTGTACSDDAA
tara:strand:+ start:180 stop:395 length:216 start_codon:yes stop_codon:yes gene_type:complete